MLLFPRKQAITLIKMGFGKLTPLTFVHTLGHGTMGKAIGEDLKKKPEEKPCVVPKNLKRIVVLCS